MSILPATLSIPNATNYEFISPDALEAAPLRRAVEYWQSKCSARRFPARTDILPKDIAALLRHISLIKVEGDDFLYRVVGDVIVRAFDIPMQGRRISELAHEAPGFGTIIRPLLSRCVQQKSIIAVRGQTGRDAAGARFTDYENVLLPLGPDDDTVDHLMVVSWYHARPFARS